MEIKVFYEVKKVFYYPTNKPGHFRYFVWGLKTMYLVLLKTSYLAKPSHFSSQM
jgi:hypothetical protein